jgi:hypothetical protein
VNSCLDMQCSMSQLNSSLSAIHFKALVMLKIFVCALLLSDLRLVRTLTCALCSVAQPIILPNRLTLDQPISPVPCCDY